MLSPHILAPHVSAEQMVNPPRGLLVGGAAPVELQISRIGDQTPSYNLSLQWYG